MRVRDRSIGVDTTPGPSLEKDKPAKKVVAAATLDGTGETTPVDRLRGALSVLRPKRGKLRLLTPEEVEKTCARLAGEGLDVKEIGRSRGGRPLFGITVGHGPISLAAIAAAHPDEPMGTATALHLVETLARHPRLEWLREQITLHVVPLADPDGSQDNAAWVAQEHAPLDLFSYFRYVSRSTGAADTEFAFPSSPGGRAHPHNEAIARFLDGIGGIDHFVSLHSIFLSGGAWFLVNAADRRAASPRLRFLLEEAGREGLPLHDEESSRMFAHIAPGLSEAPRSGALGLSTKNSMDYVRAFCGAELALVTELPMCFAPGMSSKKALSTTKAEAARKKHEALWWSADAAASLLDQLAAFDLSPDGRRHLSRYQTLTGRGHGEARLPSGTLTEGDVVFSETTLVRRRALYLGAALAALEGAKEDEASALRERLGAEFEDAVTAFTKLHRTKRASMETQCHLQMAAVLSGALPLL